MDRPASDETFWKRCSSCKKEIPFGGAYYLCSVTTCRHKRKGVRFCSVGCWDAHLGYANHRSAYAEEAEAPSKERYLRELEEEEMNERAPRRTVVEPPPRKSEGAPSETADSGALSPDAVETDVLVVVSKVKKLIKDLSDFNTSQDCVDALTKKVVEECMKGIEEAKKAGRRTVMARDIK